MSLIDVNVINNYTSNLVMRGSAWKCVFLCWVGWGVRLCGPALDSSSRLVQSLYVLRRSQSTSSSLRAGKSFITKIIMPLHILICIRNRLSPLRNPNFTVSVYFFEGFFKQLKYVHVQYRVEWVGELAVGDNTKKNHPKIIQKKKILGKPHPRIPCFWPNHQISR